MKSSVFHTFTRKAQWVWFAGSKGVICRRGVGIKNPGGNGDDSEPIVMYILGLWLGDLQSPGPLYICVVRTTPGIVSHSELILVVSRNPK